MENAYREIGRVVVAVLLYVIVRRVSLLFLPNEPSSGFISMVLGIVGAFLVLVGWFYYQATRE